MFQRIFFREERMGNDKLPIILNVMIATHKALYIKLKITLGQIL